MLFHCGAELREIEILQDETESGHLRETADVLVMDGAFFGRLFPANIW